MAETGAPLSTSALAKALKKTTKQMFQELEALGWIERRGDNWALTAKGEFEGGSYRESQKFGRYIIWPAAVVEHQFLSNPDAQLISTTLLAKHFDLSRKAIDRLLQELGWVAPGRKGWLVTAAGALIGGHQRENSRTGVPFVLWVPDLTEQNVLQSWVDNYLNGRDEQLCCDGHQVECDAHRKIDNWLYLFGLLHAYKRRLPVEEQLYADFYLPEHQLYIEYWGGQLSPSQLAKKMRLKEIYTSAGLNLIELKDKDVDQLDEVLPRLLLKFNIEC